MDREIIIEVKGPLNRDWTMVGRFFFFFNFFFGPLGVNSGTVGQIGLALFGPP